MKFEPGKTYKTKGGHNAVVVGTIVDDDLQSSDCKPLLVGYIIEPDKSQIPMFWAPSDGNRWTGSHDYSLVKSTEAGARIFNNLSYKKRTAISEVMTNLSDALYRHRAIAGILCEEPYPDLMEYLNDRFIA